MRGKKRIEYPDINDSSHQAIISPENAKTIEPKKLDFFVNPSSLKKRYMKIDEKKGVKIIIIDHASIWGRIRKRKPRGWKPAD